MFAQVIKLELLLLSFIYCYSSLQHQGPISSGIAQAFLFQQLHPILSPPTSYSSFSSYENSSTNHPSYLSNHNHQQQQQNRLSNTNRAQNDHIYFARNSTLASGKNDDTEDIKLSNSNNDCPIECQCNKAAQIADCSNRNLDRVPSGFPKDIKRIRLERNNITELGPYAFQGLKRLQRIDLSNNNLLKIDPLAFAGGLQSLNSLILYSNKLNQLPPNLFSELSQLQLLLLNANSLQCINRELFQSLANLNLLSLYDNNIETLANGTFDGLKNIKTIHLGKNPLVCNCNLRWLADYLELNPIETSEARCESPQRNQGKKLSQINKQKFRCEGNEQARASQIANQCSATAATVAQSNNASPPPPPPPPPATPESCPPGCICNGSTVDCSRASLTETRTGGGIYELPDIPDDVPVYVTRMRINDTRIKRIRQTGLFRRLANSQKLDLGNNKIVDIEDNAINGAGGSTKPERVVFVLLENESCDASRTGGAGQEPQKHYSNNDEDGCSMAPRVNAPNFDSPCYNGGSCITGNALKSLGRQQSFGSTNYSCLCPPGFAGPLCEINIDDCEDHQCQNGAKCIDGVNSYKCICRDPTTTGEFCEQLSLSSLGTGSGGSMVANSIGPIALPMVAASGGGGNNLAFEPLQQANAQQQQQLQLQPISKPQQSILARSADLSRAPTVDLAAQPTSGGSCKRITRRKHYEDGNGCHSVRVLKLSECAGTCGTFNSGGSDCCLPAKVKRRRVRMQCSDGASYVKTIDLVKKCACSGECSNQIGDFNQQQQQQQQQQSLLANQFNATQEDQLLQITRLDAVD